MTQLYDQPRLYTTGAIPIGPLKTDADWTIHVFMRLKIGFRAIG